jgi:hypothetical protein
MFIIIKDEVNTIKRVCDWIKDEKCLINDEKDLMRCRGCKLHFNLLCRENAIKILDRNKIEYTLEENLKGEC